MTIKQIQMDPLLGYGTFTDTMGGQYLSINASTEIREMIVWWRNWGPVFKDKSPTVQDALEQARVLHELAREQPTNKA